ncbi:hydrolase [Oceanobacillus iheyensis]|uniref:Hydrolase n=1 Tax=Oceanobacillus iheyensis (strain DSM 14371 / CIP 107618 / JCM 11309 / KCTC 3954 / HTE831) TaxID=221109 RepID=Q8ENZ8_OCEIH|nr:hypothetical protein [Oceanobacillus iheyensis]BAC14277.1 hypothetical protein [Oceanobacillus iheyensis HTE831]
MDKQKYFISVGEGEISQVRYQNNDDFVIYATEDEITLLRSKFEDMHESSFDSFKRAHIPFMPYHNDEANDMYDNTMTEAFQLLYDLGDEKTKNHIQTMGILSDKHL